MGIAADLYPDEAKEQAEHGSFYGPCSYQPILDSFGPIVVQVDDDGYDGDSRVLYKFDTVEWGVLIFGWGSCSGCDALQACESLQQIDELIDGLARGIKRGTREEIVAWLDDKDIQETKFSCHAEEWAEFVTKAKEALA